MSPTLNKTETVGAHTPGPWNVFYKHKYDEWHVSVPTSGSGLKLGLFPDGIRTDNSRADAYLIAAGPELLALAKAYEAWEADLILNNAWDNKDGLPSLTPAQYAELLRLQAMRNAAIAKATGSA